MGQFIKRGDRGVWEGAKNLPSFAQSDKSRIKAYWKKYLQDNPIVFREEYEAIKRHRANNAKNLTDHWKHWGGANNNVKVSVDFDTSSTLEMQRNLCKDAQQQITNPNELYFAASLMCCDDPGQTTNFILRRFFEINQVPFEKRFGISNKVNAFVALMMEIAFFAKWEADEWRPSDYEVEELKGLEKKGFVSVSIIPHPNHPTRPSGHSTVGKAVIWKLKKIGQLEGIPMSKDFEKFGNDEIGEARISAGIHWPADHLAAQAIVDEFGDLVDKKLQ